MTAPEGRRVRSVDEVTLDLKRTIEAGFRRVWVQGEVVGCRPASSGHVYFNLKGREATLPAVMWRNTAARLTRPLRDGDQLTCQGDVEVYAPQGKYQLIVTAVELAGEGALLAALEALKKKLYAEGLFAPERKRPLPHWPRRVGLVTSQTGAAVRDLVRSIHALFPARILIAHAAVQGEQAPASLVAALGSIASVEDVDVIVIGRGGGSLEDLWAFNDERLARAIAACPKPVVSAVGHEIDTPLSDYVADVRAPTPTYAGSLVVPSFDDLSTQLTDLGQRLGRGLLTTTSHARSRLKLTAARLRDPRRLVRERWQRLDDSDARLRHAIARRLSERRTRLEQLRVRLEAAHPARRLAREHERLDVLTERLARAIRLWLDRRRTALTARQSTLAVLSPTASLGRGYAIVRKAGRVVRASGEVQPGDAIEVLLHQGAIDAEVRASRSVC